MCINFLPHLLLQSVAQSSCLCCCMARCPQGNSTGYPPPPSFRTCVLWGNPSSQEQNTNNSTLHAEKFNCYLWSALNAREMLFLALLRARAAGIWQGNG